MKTRAIVVIVALLIPVALFAQVNKTVNADEMTLGYMNVSELPSNGGAFVYGDAWDLVDLTAVYAGTGFTNVTLGPNTIGDPNEFWYQCVNGDKVDCGGPGAPGNKSMEANLYAEVTDALAGQTVTFSGQVISNTLTGAHTVIAFIKDFAPDYSSNVQTDVPLSATGVFSVTALTDAGAGRHVQWGLQMTGENVWITDVGPFGTMVIGPDPAVPTETSSWGSIKSMFR